MIQVVYQKFVKELEIKRKVLVGNMSNKNLYTEDSIESLSPLAFTRLRPQVYAGDCTYSTQLLVEIISNAIDEFRLGHGNLIKVNIDKDIILTLLKIML